ELFNVRGSIRRSYQSYESTSGDCDEAPPADVLFTDTWRDSTTRVLSTIEPDAEVYNGTASTSRLVYEPLKVLSYDAEDNDPTSPHANTPTVVESNGLGQTVALHRQLEDEGELATLIAHYDGLGRLTGYTDPMGHRKEQQYDLLGRVLRVDDPNSSGPSLYTYDDAGNATAVEDGRGIVTRSAYDGANRLVAKWDNADESGTRIEWTYDDDPNCRREVCTNTEGQVASITYPGLGGTRFADAFGFDVRGRPILQSRTFDNATFDMLTRYDNANRAIAVTFPDGTLLERQYDAANRLTAIPGVVDAVTYDARGQMATTSCADGTETRRSYDARLRMSQTTTTNLAGDVLQGFDYTYDRAGNILSIVDFTDLDLGHRDASAHYTYDAWYRLLEAQQSPGQPGEETVSYRTNTIDNILSKTSSLGDKGYT
ncbi:MAG: hypothetical protein AAFX99_36560, partial [Myxococcota bacterium]